MPTLRILFLVTERGNGEEGKRIFYFVWLVKWIWLDFMRNVFIIADVEKLPYWWQLAKPLVFVALAMYSSICTRLRGKVRLLPIALYMSAHEPWEDKAILFAKSIFSLLPAGSIYRIGNCLFAFQWLQSFRWSLMGECLLLTRTRLKSTGADQTKDCQLRQAYDVTQIQKPMNSFSFSQQ